MAGQRDEHVVQRRAAQADVGRIDARRIEPADRVRQRARACRGGQRDGPIGAVIRAESRARGRLRRFGHLHLDHRAAEPVLQLVAGPLGDEPAFMDHADPIGELVGFIEILRGQQHRRTRADQIPDQRPHVHAAARVDAGGRLIEKQDVGPAHQRRGQVQAPLHPARVGAHQPVGVRCQRDPFQDLRGALAGDPRAQVVQPAHHLDRLAAGQVLVHGGPRSDRAPRRCRRPWPSRRRA